ncbi:TcfC E-set like domain-containing protein [Vibrio crassostreae]|uniref:TcfC E-set like domain-containing protein n=1 Tax=Vibrio crassostreae TaxID=246167 RepID=UPI0002EF8871|nr:TcfC E-set like domain-containing protein [Vibrio crassostreae]OEE88936.1 hypothetical protein A140_18870 [Vibrio crassostreae 9ZC88]
MKYIYIASAAGLLFSFSSFAVIPEGFKSFYIEKQVNTSVNFNGSETTVSALMSFERYKVSQKGTGQLRKFLGGKVKPEYIDKLVAYLNDGVTYSEYCVGKSYEQCAFMPEDIALVFDYPTKQAKVFVHPDGLIKEVTQQEYDDGILDNNALINSVSLDASYDSESNTDSSLYGDATLGVHYGYFNAKYEISEQSEFSNLTYTLDRPGYAFVADYAKDGARTYSSFGLFPSSNPNGEVYSLGVVTSENLNIDKGDNGQVLNVFSPVNGVMRMYKGDRLIASKNVSSGFTKVPYSGLPNGIYEVTIEISERNEVVSTYNTQIYNLNTSRTHSNYSLRYSFIDRQDRALPSYLDNVVSPETLSDFQQDTGILESEFVLPVLDSARLGFYALLADNLDYGLGIGGEVINDIFNVVGSVKVYDDMAYQLSSGVSFGPFNLSYSDINHTDGFSGHYPLSRLMNGSQSESLLSLGYFTQLGERTTFNLSINEARSTDYETFSADSEIGYRFTNGWEVNLGAGYDKQSATTSKEDEYSASIRLSIPLSRNIEFYSYNSGKAADFISRNEIQYSGESIDSAGVRTTIEKDAKTESELFVVDSYKNDVFDIDYRGELDSERLNASTFINNTQVISTEGIFFTADSNKSYLIETPKVVSSEAMLSNDVLGTARVSTEDRSNNYIRIGQNDFLVGLESYKGYSHQFMPNNTSYILAEESLLMTDHFSLPGSVVHVQPHLVSVSSNMVRLSIEGNEVVESAQCLTDSCYDANEIAPGIYNVKYAGKHTLLSNNHVLCSVETDLSSAVASSSCFPEVEPLSEFVLGKGEYIMLSVIFEDNVEIKRNMERTFGKHVLFHKMGDNVEVAYIPKSLADRYKISQFTKNNEEMIISLRNVYKRINEKDEIYAQN